MTDPRLEDHVVGLELQLVELVERRERALVQGLADEAEAISDEIDEVQTELIVSAEALASRQSRPPRRGAGRVGRGRHLHPARRRHAPRVGPPGSARPPGPS